MFKPKIKMLILFLGYDNSQTKLVDELLKKDCKVFLSKDKVSDFDKYDLVISFGYRHIIKKEVIKKAIIPFINLHISYLPWNRGAHPNFWSFFESTPTGVSIHLIDGGIDTGPIIVQKKVKLDPANMNFKETHSILIDEIERLFLTNIDQIINKTFKIKPQKGEGSYHKKSDLPSSFRGWEKNIKNEINRLHQKT